MPILRLSHSGSILEASFEHDGSRQTERRSFAFSISRQDAEDIRWYLEDYRIYPLDPAPKIARRIKDRLEQIGRDLFRLALSGGPVWTVASRNIRDTRIEIETDLAGADLPWELIRDPLADIPLALEARAFVRKHSEPARSPNPAAISSGSIRILLVICRLRDDPVAFRSVAQHLIRGLNNAAREQFYLELLRPPSFESLAKRLRTAQAQNEPFHVVHFDGHGLTGEIFFENSRLSSGGQAVRAEELGKLLNQAGVPLLVLNACRSAAHEPPAEPDPATDAHASIRKFGSLAHAVADYGTSGVLAWRYNVFVDTAAQFMADLYSGITSGLSFGEAAALARKQLSSAGGPIEDWSVPVVFEAAPLRLFAPRKEKLQIRLDTRQSDEVRLPQPDIQFIGRDETLLRLDRAFDQQNIVLLHGFAGSGKTTTAAEFARWYGQTAGIDGPILLTSFEHYKPLPRVLDELGRRYEALLSKQGIQWLTLDDGRRRDIAIQILQQEPVFWVWDNVEPVAGFPSGAASAWSVAEQGELLDFLRLASRTPSKFLLTSRRDERAWLGSLPARVELPPMTFQDCVQMTKNLANKMGRCLEDVEDWRPLVRFTQGNPLTLIVVVGQALRDRLTTRPQIESFVRQLEAGEVVFKDEAQEGRTRSLAASLTYGFEHAFTEAERKQLALLYLFQGFVNREVFRAMGNPRANWSLSEVQGLTSQAAESLFAKAAEVGLLSTPGGGYYYIHPALPWFFRRLFEQSYAGRSHETARAWVQVIAELSEYYFWRYESGDRDVIGPLQAEEQNLICARKLALSHGWLDQAVAIMQGLWSLYEHYTRFSDWSRLVHEIAQSVVNAETGQPVSGRETEWSIVTQYLTQLARMNRRHDEAARLLRIRVDWERSRALQILRRPPRDWTAAESDNIRSLATSLHELGQVRRESGDASCVDLYQEGLSLAEAIQDSQGAATCAFNIGIAHLEIALLRNLDSAERWFRRSLELAAHADRMYKARCLAQLGEVAHQRFMESSMAADNRDAVKHLSEAAGYYEEALSMTPAEALRDFAINHHQLGTIYSNAGDMERALRHYQTSIRLGEAIQQDRRLTGHTRANAARALAAAGRFADAREWALAAMRDFQSSENADQEIVVTLQLLERIESLLRANAPPS